jgi:hypothetical protein
VRVGEDQPGECELLGMCGREGEAAGADPAGQAIRQLVDPVDRVYCGQR